MSAEPPVSSPPKATPGSLWSPSRARFPINVAVIFLYFAVAILSVQWQRTKLMDRLIVSAGTEAARGQVQMLTAVRTVYTEEIVTVALANGLQITHEPQTNPHSIPLPATFALRIGERMTESGHGGRTRLYSPYPFPWRAAEGGLRDDFQKEAWERLQADPQTVVVRTINTAEGRVLRYAVADRMRASCVKCHNEHPDSPRTGWKEGDVRGVLEVELSLGPSEALASRNLMDSSALLAALAIAGGGVDVSTMLQFTRASAVLESSVQERTADLERANQILLTEISERKQAESALHLSEFSVANASLPSFWITRDARIQRVNRAACDLLGYSEAELLTLAIPDLDPDFPAERWPAHWEELRSLKRMQFQTRHRHQQGRIIPVEVELNWFEFEGQEYNFAFVRDITEQQRAQELLAQRDSDKQAQRLAALNLAQDAEEARQRAQRSEERLNLALKSSGVGIWNWNIAGHTIFWDHYIHPLFGLKPGEFSGTYEAFEALLDPGERERVQREVTQSIEQNTEYDTEFRVVWPDGSSHYLATRGKVYRDVSGQALNMTGVCWDITESRQAQETLARQAQELARSNTELQQFAYIASHDLQEPLRKVQSFGSMIESAAGTSLSADAKDYLQRMRNAAARMQQLINDLLTYSRVTTQAKPFESVDLNLVAREVLGDLEARIQTTGGRVDLGELPTLGADPLQIRQLLQNLIGNALKFHRKDVPPVVSVQSRPVTLEAGIGPGGPAREITVQDNGIGFDEKYLGKLFAPFSRLHGRSEYEGTGIGLAICKKIVDRHGGTIVARSVPGEGTRFIVTLPFEQDSGVSHHDSGDSHHA